MSFPSATIDTRPSLVSAVTINNLTADVARVADQNQMVMQDSNAFSGAKSRNDMTDTAAITQEASSANNKDIEIVPPVDADAVNVLAADHDSIGRATIDQNQGTIQNTFAQGTDFDGNPSESVNNLNLNEGVNQNLTSEIRNLVTASEDEERRSEERGEEETESTTPASLIGNGAPQSSIRIPQSNYGFSFSLARMPLPLNVFRHEFVHPNPLQLPSTPAIESRSIVSGLVTLGPDLVFSRPMLAIHPNVFTLPAPPRLNVTA